MASFLRTVLYARQPVLNNLQAISLRNISTSVLRNDKTAVPIAKEDPPIVGHTINPSDMIGARKHHPNNLEKRFLVWSGKFKTVDEVPETVSQETMEKSRNKARIKIANLMIVATICGCIGVVISGKNAAKRGESVQQQNLEWHRQVKEDAMAAEAK